MAPSSATEEFYQELYNIMMTVPDVDLDQVEENIMEVGQDEVESALKPMKDGKSRGPDNVAKKGHV